MSFLFLGKKEGKVAGRKAGRIKGKIESLLMLLRDRFGDIPSNISELISKLDDAEQIDELIRQTTKIDSIDQLQW